MVISNLSSLSVLQNKRKSRKRLFDIERYPNGLGNGLNKRGIGLNEV